MVSISSGLMAINFLILACMWFYLDGQTPNWLPGFFLIIYGSFWLCVGLHNLSVSLLYGKLVKPVVRGRLMLTALPFGAGIAIACAWFLMRPWLNGTEPQFMWLFACSGLSFATAAGLVTQLKEQPDSSRSKTKTIRQTLGSAIEIVRTDKNFRRLAWIAAAFGMSITLFPHYQAYARLHMHLGMESLVGWVIAQNLGAAVLSIPTGAIADRWGNRLAIRTSMLLLCGTRP